jgi:hypothetical protein
MSVRMCSEEGKLDTLSVYYTRTKEYDSTQGGYILVSGTEQEHVD